MTVELHSRFPQRVLAAIFVPLLGCVLSVAAQQFVKPAKSFTLNGVNLSSPDQAGWRVTKSEKLEIVFELSDVGKAFRAFAKVGPYDAPADLERSIEHLEILKNSEIENLPNLKRDSLHFLRTEFKETACLQYDSILKNQAPSPRSFEYYNLYGYLCPHPTSKGNLVQLEFSSRSDTRGFSAADLKLLRRYFDSVRFTKIKD